MHNYKNEANQVKLEAECSDSRCWCAVENPAATGSVYVYDVMDRIVRTGGSSSGRQQDPEHGGEIQTHVVQRQSRWNEISAAAFLLRFFSFLLGGRFTKPFP